MKVDQFVTEEVKSKIFDPLSSISDSVSKFTAASSILEEEKSKLTEISTEELNILNQKLGMLFNNGILSELTKTARNEDGDVAGKTTNYQTLYKKIRDLKEMLNFKDNEKLALTGSMPTTNKTSDGRLDADEVGMYGECLHCGKKLDKPSKNGFCSKKCETEYHLLKFKRLARDIRESKEKILDKMTSAVNLCNNFLGQLNDMNNELSSIENSGFDDRYKVYFKVGLTSVIQYLKRSINEMLIQKNEYIISKIEKKAVFIKDSVETLEDNAMKGAFDKIDKAISAAQKLNDKMNEVYEKARNYICNNDPTRIEPDCLSFGMTVRSNTYYPMKFAQKLENFNEDDSASDVIASKDIIEYVEKLFPRLHENDYAENEAVFYNKLIYSSYNTRKQETIIDLMCDTWKKGAEPLPKYEKLKVPAFPPYLNIFWMVYLFSSFGPHGQKHYALPFMP